MMHEAHGTFDVKVAPSKDGVALPEGLSRFRLEKQLHGGLEGTSAGEMLGGGDPAKGEAGYVCIEKFTGTLDGRAGSFALQHSATMSKGTNAMSIMVVPGSGSGELAGIAGKFSITIAEGKHSYNFEYTLPE